MPRIITVMQWSIKKTTTLSVWNLYRRRARVILLLYLYAWWWKSRTHCDRYNTYVKDLLPPPREEREREKRKSESASETEQIEKEKKKTYILTQNNGSRTSPRDYYPCTFTIVRLVDRSVSLRSQKSSSSSSFYNRRRPRPVSEFRVGSPYNSTLQ